MKDELDKLKQAFEQEPEIKASDRAKKIAMQSAVQAFEKQQVNKDLTKETTQQNKINENNFQGNSEHARQKEEDRKKVGLLYLLDWSKLMKHSYLFPVIAGTAVVFVLFSAVGPSILSNKSSVDRQYNKPLASENNTAANQWAGYDLKGNDVAIAGSGGQTNQTWVSKNSTLSITSLEKPSAKSDQSSVSQTSPVGNDKFEPIKTNPLKLTKAEPVSTYSVDVDTASYSFMRSSLLQGRLPQKNAVRVEELINYFPYDYEQSEDKTQPFNVSTTVTPTPWNENTKLLHIGIKGYDLPKQDNPKSNLVFLLDTSGSMNSANKLPLIINSFKLLLSTLQDDDTVSIVAYAGSAGTVLEPTKVKNKAKIILALERLRAGGSTAGGQGIRLAYQLAETNYDKDAVNRVLLATDGDFNVGIRNKEELKDFVERKRKSGVYLSVLGFGRGNYNDALMQKLAQNGNGNAAYIDSLSEARKVLVEEASSTLFTIAKDVKIQMEFNPKTVSEYRLIGYETRALKREDFNNDKVDAGDIGAGHTVTAIYEITPVDSENNAVDPLRYGEDTAIEDKVTELKTLEEAKVKQTEYGFLRLRYKLPDEDKSKLIQTPINIADTVKNINSTSVETRFATAVAAFGQLLRDGKYTKSYNFDDVIELAQSAKGEDKFGYRAEFINLVRLAKTAQVLPQ